MPIGRVWGYQAFGSNSGLRGFNPAFTSHAGYQAAWATRMLNVGFDDFFFWLFWGREEPSGQHFAANVMLRQAAKTQPTLKGFADYQKQFATMDYALSLLGFPPCFYVGPVDSYINLNDPLRVKYAKCKQLMEPLLAWSRSRGVAVPSIIIDSLGERFINETAGIEVVKILMDLGCPRVGFEPSAKVRENVAEPREQAPWHLLPNGIAVITDGLWTNRIEYPAANGWYIPKSKHAGEFVIMVSAVERDSVWVAQRLSEGYSVAVSVESPLWQTQTAQSLKAAAASF